MNFENKPCAKSDYHIDYDFRPEALSLGDIDIIQTGRRYTEPGSKIEAHLHQDWFELTIVTDGACTVLTNGESCYAQSPDIHLAYPCEIHEIIPDAKKKLEYDFLSFNVKGTLREEFEKIIREHISGTSRIFRDERISYLTSSAISEFTEQKPYDKMMLTCIINQILIYIIRDFKNIKSTETKAKKADVLCQQMMSYIDTHIYSMERLETLSQVFNYNYSYLSDLFKKTTNKTLAEYYRTRKLETAKMLISENNAGVAETAYLLGYSSTFAFSNAFKQKYGIAPQKIKSQKR